MKLKLDPVERQVVKVLLKLDTMSGRWGAVRCTSEVKGAIVGAGKGLGFHAYATDRRDANCEWLYDVCWCKQNGDFVVDMPLALECEWGAARQYILEDFQKLLVSRAAHRVFLCSQSAIEDWHDCLGYLIDQIRDYRGTADGDRYLFGNWGSGTWRFEQYVHPGQRRDVGERVWLFQALDDYDLYSQLRRRKQDWWLAKHHRDKLQPGNQVLLWQSGPTGGIRGLGELTGRPYPAGDEWRIGVRYKKLINPQIDRATLRNHPILRNLSVLRMPRGTNFRVRDGEWAALKSLL